VLKHDLFCRVGGLCQKVRGAAAGSAAPPGRVRAGAAGAGHHAAAVQRAAPPLVAVPRPLPPATSAQPATRPGAPPAARKSGLFLVFF